MIASTLAIGTDVEDYQHPNHPMKVRIKHVYRRPLPQSKVYPMGYQ
jgi:hypothetical protein